MKKDLIFAPVLILIGAALFMLRATGMTVHIAVSVAGVVVLAVYSALTKKEWKLPALEIIMRVFYGIALISGIALKLVEGIAIISFAHKIAAVLFMAFIIIVFTHKLATSKKA